MIRFVILLGGMLLVSAVAPGAETAQARLFCLSLRFQTGTDTSGFSTLDLTTIASSWNGEVAPTFFKPDHFSFFRQYDTVLDETVQEGEMDFDTPAFADLNGNGSDDFFEVARTVSAVSTGTYASAIDSGTVRATWSRAAGSKEGVCVLRLTSKTFGLLGDFTHTFELLEYRGTLNFTPGPTNITGSVSLTQTGNPGEQWTGPVEFVRWATNPFNRLDLRPGAWTNAGGQTRVYTNDVYYRDEGLGTNYFGYIYFDDGDPATPGEPDYQTSVLCIDDPNDSNGNGIPDFSDDASPGNGAPPVLTLTLGQTELSLGIAGTVGRTHEVQRVDTLSQTNWVTVSSVTLTNDSQMISLSIPTNGTGFWRVRAL